MERNVCLQIKKIKLYFTKELKIKKSQQNHVLPFFTKIYLEVMLKEFLLIGRSLSYKFKFCFRHANAYILRTMGKEVDLMLSGVSHKAPLNL